MNLECSMRLSSLMTIGLALAASIVLLSSCNRGKTIIDEATSVYLNGDPLEAARILERVEVEAPNTAEVKQARDLAVEWLTRKSELELGENRRTYLLAALQWAPSDPDLNSRRCEVELTLKNWEAARTCLKEVSDRIPGREQQRQEEILALHDKEIADSEARARLLESNDPISLYRLLADFPGSDESHTAAERLPALSLCADLERFADILFTGGQTGPAGWGARLKAQDSQGYQRSVLSEIRRSTDALNKKLDVLRTELQGHTLMFDEKEVRDMLIEGYDMLQPAMTELHSSFSGKAYKIEQRIKKVDRFARTFIETRQKIEAKRDAAQQACKALGR
jgi:hypothetical protein